MDVGHTNALNVGGKMSNWEGGIRVNAFAVCGYLPSEVLGTKQEGLIAGERL